MSVPFLTSWLISQEARVRQGGAQRIHGVCTPNTPSRSPLTFFFPLALSASKLFSLPLCMSLCFL